MSGPESFLELIGQHLRSCAIEFMVTGSFVSTFYGDPRTTRDLDFVINASEPPDDNIRDFAALCEASGPYVSVLRVQSHRLDRPYLAQWARELGLEGLLDDALIAAGM